MLAKNRQPWLALAAALLALACFYATPWLALHQLRAAANSGDARALAKQVDFAALRAGLKRGVQARLAGLDRNEQGDPTPASTLGAAVAGALLGPMVDALITPRGGGPAAAGSATGLGGAAQQSSPNEEDAEPDTEAGYESLNRFVLRVQRRDAPADEEPVALVLHRRGLLSWQLAELRLP